MKETKHFNSFINFLDKTHQIATVSRQKLQQTLNNYYFYLTSTWKKICNYIDPQTLEKIYKNYSLNTKKSENAWKFYIDNIEYHSPNDERILILGKLYLAYGCDKLYIEKEKYLCSIEDIDMDDFSELPNYRSIQDIEDLVHYQLDHFCKLLEKTHMLIETIANQLPEKEKTQDLKKEIITTLTEWKEKLQETITKHRKDLEKYYNTIIQVWTDICKEHDLQTITKLCRENFWLTKEEDNTLKAYADDIEIHPPDKPVTTVICYLTYKDDKIYLEEDDGIYDDMNKKYVFSTYTIESIKHQLDHFFAALTRVHIYLEKLVRAM